MSERINASICINDIYEASKNGHSAISLAKNGKKYANLTIWINDEKDKFDNDVSIQLNSKQDQRESEGKVYVGNGKKNRLPEITGMKAAPTMASQTDCQDLPF